MEDKKYYLIGLTDAGQDVFLGREFFAGYGSEEEAFRIYSELHLEFNYMFWGIIVNTRLAEGIRFFRTEGELEQAVCDRYDRSLSSHEIYYLREQKKNFDEN